LENISYEGAYFRSDDTPPIEPGQIRHFTITAIEQQSDLPFSTFIEGTCRVVRIDPSETDCGDRGIAVEFISAKIFELLTKIS
jgi:hypothetical protein